MQKVVTLGHTEEKHVTSKTQLRKRFYGCKLNAVSSYFTYGDADKMINQILSKNTKRINHWIDEQKTINENKRLVLYGTSSNPVGFGYFRTNEGVEFDENLKKACIVLEKKGEQYNVVTSYLVR